MRVAVTGATGVLGRGTIRSLVDAGHEVVAMARDDEGADLVTGVDQRPDGTSSQDPGGTGHGNAHPPIFR